MATMMFGDAQRQPAPGVSAATTRAAVTGAVAVPAMAALAFGLETGDTVMTALGAVLFELAAVYWLLLAIVATRRP